MADLGYLINFLDELPDKVMDNIPDLIAETATTYFKESFTTKQFDGNPWKQGNPKSTGSLLVESSNLLNSITPAVITKEVVTISAGNDKVDYARVHNEGFQGEVVINPFTRKNGQKVGSLLAYERWCGKLSPLVITGGAVYSITAWQFYPSILFSISSISF